MGIVLIYIRLNFKNLTTVPSEAEVLAAANALLDTKIRRARDLTPRLNEPVSVQNITYTSKSLNSKWNVLKVMYFLPRGTMYVIVRFFRNRKQWIHYKLWIPNRQRVHLQRPSVEKWNIRFNSKYHQWPGMC